MTSLRMLPAMDIHQSNDEHDINYHLSKNRYPTDESNDPFELFICPYLSDHKVTSKRWRIHLQKCKENYGGNTQACVFNASHHVPMPEFEWHTMTCPDRNILRKEYEKRDWVLASNVNYNPDWIQPDTGETWDDELQEDAEEFTLDVKKGMPLALKPSELPKDEVYYDDDAVGQSGYDGEGNCEELNGEAEQGPSILEEELIPEKPSNWNDMSKTQRKNHKRKYDRQRQRMSEEGVTEDDFSPVKDPKCWTAKRREDKLNAIKSKFPMADDKVNASRFDYTSLLNIVCQKVRINLPEYQACGAQHGGFAYRCRVHQTWYSGQEFAATKKDAKHECAKWALLGMEIPGIDVEGPTTRAMPVHPKLLQKSAEMRAGDEVGRLMEAGMYQPKKTTALRQPKLDTSVPGSPQKIPPEEIAAHEPPAINSMANYVQQLQLTEQLQQQEQQQQQPQQQSSMNSMADFLKKQKEEEKAMEQMHAQHAPQSQQSAPRGWEGRSTPQGTPQTRPPQPQSHQLRQQVRPQQQTQQGYHQVRQVQPQQPQKAWGGWGAPAHQPANPPQKMQGTGMGGGAPGMNGLSSTMNAMSLNSGNDFPSLGSDEWKTVSKKSGAGRGRGRGRMTTTMNL